MASEPASRVPEGTSKLPGSSLTVDVVAPADASGGRDPAAPRLATDALGSVAAIDRSGAGVDVGDGKQAPTAAKGDDPEGPRRKVVAHSLPGFLDGLRSTTSPLRPDGLATVRLPRPSLAVASATAAAWAAHSPRLSNRAAAEHLLRFDPALFATAAALCVTFGSVPTEPDVCAWGVMLHCAWTLPRADFDDDAWAPAVSQGQWMAWISPCAHPPRAPLADLAWCQALSVRRRDGRVCVQGDLLGPPPLNPLNLHPTGTAGDDDGRCLWLVAHPTSAADIELVAPLRRAALVDAVAAVASVYAFSSSSNPTPLS
jgi:hypothetical protein